MADLFVSRLRGSHYVEPKNLGPRINSEYHDYDPFVAPDGDYLIFGSTRPGGVGGQDLYICFRKENGNWSDPVNMGQDINTASDENRPFATLDGKYFFFTSDQPGMGNRDVYWVDAKIIEELKPDKLK